MLNFEQNSGQLKRYGIDLTPEQFAINQSKKVIVGMSGGVDSSVSALILKLQGYQVIGMFMKNWDEKESGYCSAEVDYKDVVSVCEDLEIPYYSVDFSKEYFENVFQTFLDDLKLGLTPNPDILCNREIKFKVFFDHAMKLGADYLATGHYCQKVFEDGLYKLKKGADKNKDQTYFLYTMKDQVLAKVLFPIGAIDKKIVRLMAHDYNLSTSKKKDSTGICFIGERDFSDFISNYIKTKKGNFVDINGRFLGPHIGLPFYTKGQRKGLGVGGPGEPWFVAGKNIETNEIILAQGSNHPALYSMELIASDLSLVNTQVVQTPFNCLAKVRYRQPDQECVVTKIEDEKIYVSFLKPQRSVTEKQSIVFYKDDICLGGAIIEQSGPTLLEQSVISAEFSQNSLHHTQTSL